MSTDPKPEFKSAQFEFTDEHGRTIGGLSDAMSTSATLLQLLGVAFATLCGVQIVAILKTAAEVRTVRDFIPVVGFGAGALFCLAFGFWTARASNSFRRIVQTRNEDIWHLMNALGKLHNMYAFTRFIILASLVLAVVGVALAVFGMFQKPA
ncbi:MAG TPA: hypothetical protein VM533_06020 [Fimbriiglobus sp.]|jgi:hypothetical protein|nr:hypothetical protein [Fimbriiglobus sp.]